MSESYPYSRKKVAEPTNNVRFATPKRRIAYLLIGALIAATVRAAIDHLGSFDHEQLRTLLIDTLVTAPLLAIACFLGAGWMMEK